MQASGVPARRLAVRQLTRASSNPHPHVMDWRTYAPGTVCSQHRPRLCPTGSGGPGGVVAGAGLGLGEVWTGCLLAPRGPRGLRPNSAPIPHLRVPAMYPLESGVRKGIDGAPPERQTLTLLSNKSVGSGEPQAQGGQELKWRDWSWGKWAYPKAVQQRV